MIRLLVENAVAFIVYAGAAWGAGSIVARRLDCTSVAGLAAIRIAAGLALIGTVLFALGIAGGLTPVASAIVLAVLALTGLTRLGDAHGRLPGGISVAVAVAATIPLFVLALYPPISFDETLYHLPTVERFASSGRLPFIDVLRAPVFPNMDEVLRVPIFQLAGDTETHLVSLLATIATACLLFEWVGHLHGRSAGWLAAALFVSAPIVVELATTSMVEALLTMFVTAAFFSFDRWRTTGARSWLVASGAFAGCASATKYLGLYWTAVLFVVVLATRERRARSALVFAASAGLALAPWYARIIAFTGNPTFPFLPGIFGHTLWDTPWTDTRSIGDRLTAIVRLPWDLMVSRERAGLHPPFSPALIALVPLTIPLLFRDRTVRAMTILTLPFLLVWVWLPPDARYLMAPLPIVCAATAIATVTFVSRICPNASRAIAALAIVVMLPGPTYALYRIDRYGPPPTDRAERKAWLGSRIPEYQAIAFLERNARPDAPVWLCGAEQLSYHFDGIMYGDLAGSARFDLLTSARDGVELQERMRTRGARYLLVAKRYCSIPALHSVSASTRFTRLFEDDYATVLEMR